MKLSWMTGRRFIFVFVAMIGALLPYGCTTPDRGVVETTFTVMSDMRSFLAADEFRATATAVAEAGPGNFIVSPGDVDPPAAVLEVLQDVIGPAVVWYPVAGNHDAETPEDMTWLREYNPGGTTLPEIVNPGPLNSVETCYSFDHGSAHFVILNEYFTGSVDNDPTGDVSPALLAWLDDDLATTTQPVIFVFGHEPAFPQPDSEIPHSLRHEGDSLDAFPANRNAFWQTLADHGVIAYFCGHTHGTSLVKIDGVWQIDDGHAAGNGYDCARSTFIHLRITDTNNVGYTVWRMKPGSTVYDIDDEGWL